MATPPHSKKSASGKGDGNDAPEIKYPRRTARRKLTRIAILKAAEKLFGESGFGATTLQMIADAADVHVATLSLHFKTKSDLALGLVTQRADDLRTRAFEARGSISFFEFFRQEAQRLIDDMEVESGPGVALWKALQKDRELAFAWSNYRSEQKSIYADYIATELDLDRADDYRPDLIAALMSQSTLLPQMKWIESTGRLALSDEIFKAVDISERAARVILEPVIDNANK